MGRNLFTAHDQWAKRPPDERFTDFKSLLAYCKRKRDIAREGTIEYHKTSISPGKTEGSLNIVFPNGRQAGFTNWSFKVFAGRTGTRPDSVQDLPPEMVADIMNYRLDRMDEEDDDRQARCLFSLVDGQMTTRAFTGPQYTRIWDYEVVERLMQLQESGWKVPPAMEGGDWSAEIKQGGGGLYASDRDLFVFMVNEENRIDNGSDRGMARGFFCGNSEVGAGAYEVTFFLYDFVCGNHIVWGASDVERQAIRHIGDAVGNAESLLEEMLERYSSASVRQIETDIKAAKRFKLGSDNEEVESLLFSKRWMPRKVIRATLEMAEQFSDVHGDPLSAWGFASGLTRVSQLKDHSDQRVHLDQVAGKVLSLVG